MEALAFFALYQRGARWTTPVRKVETTVNIIVAVSGVFILVGGCYSSISASEFLELAHAVYKY